MHRWVRVARHALPVCCLLFGSWAVAQVCAVPQNNGVNVTSSAGQVVNGYYTPANGTYSAGAQPTIALSAARGSSTWVAGDLALLIQMQCVDLDRTESVSYGDGTPSRPAHGYLETGAGTCKVGAYEYVPAGAGTSATSFVAGAVLQNTYVQANPTSTTPRRSFQVVRVPQYGNLTLGGTLTGLAWNGTNGGVLALDVAKTLNFAGQTIDMGARGFRGGGGRRSTANGNNPNRHREGDSVSHASKGEGIAGTPRYLWEDASPFDRSTIVGTFVDSSALAYSGYPGTGTTADYDFARGGPGNAGGGGQYFDGVYHNGGGGGGGNGGTGGRGAFGWRAAGWGGVAADYSNIEAVTTQHLAAYGGGAFGGASVARVVLGGGGGAGDENGNSGDNNGPLSRGRVSGATGGGVVMIRAGVLSGGGTIDIRGGAANDQPLNDAAGGGAAGGSLILVSPNWTGGALTVNAQGGRGGDSWLSGGSAHSGGGGGGGGVVVRTGAASTNISGGPNGLTNTADTPPGGADHGAVPGNDGVDISMAESGDPVSNSGYKCLPLTNLSLSKVASTSTLSIGQTTHFVLTIGNSGPQQATAATVIDVRPTGLGTLTFVSATGSNASTTLTASAVNALTTFTGTITVPVNQTLTITLRAVAAANGAPVNSATVNAPALANDLDLSDNTGSAGVVIGPSADLSATKVANTPTLVTGQTTTFTLTFVNDGPSAVVGARLTDTLPTGMGTLTFVSASVASGSTLTSRTVAGSVFNGTATLPVNSTLTVLLRAVAASVGTVINTTTIAPPTGTSDVDSSNNTGTAQVNIGPQADLSVSKSATPTVIYVGQTTLFTVTVLNLGPNTATAATLNDTLPSGLSGMTILSITTSSAAATVTARATSSTQANATLTIPPNGSIVFALSAIASNAGAKVNVVSVSPPASLIDPVLSNNTASATVTIPVSTNITITKTNAVSTVVSGSSTVYTITVSNLGPNAAAGTVLTDPAATGLNCTSVACSASGGAVCPASPTIPALQGAGLTIPTFPAVSELVFTVTCGITATGL